MNGVELNFRGGLLLPSGARVSQAANADISDNDKRARLCARAAVTLNRPPARLAFDFPLPVAGHSRQPEIFSS